MYNGQSAGFMHRFERVLSPLRFTVFGETMSKRWCKCVRKEKVLHLIYLFEYDSSTFLPVGRGDVRFFLFV